MAEGVFPKADGEVYFGKDANMNWYQGALAGTLNHASVDTADTEVLIIAANSSRQTLLITNNGSNTIFLGLTGVADTTGYPLDPTQSILLYNREAVYGICASGLTSDARYLEAQ
jgi:hypothetical protein